MKRDRKIHRMNGIKKGLQKEWGKERNKSPQNERTTGDRKNERTKERAMREREGEGGRMKDSQNEQNKKKVYRTNGGNK